MTNNIVYCGYFDFEKTTIWTTAMYRDIQSVFTEISNNIQIITLEIEEHTNIEELIIINGIKSFIKNHQFTDKNNELYFYVLENILWDNYETRERCLNGDDN